MTACTDPQRGRLLHAYELGWLPEEEAEAFELHCLDCAACFARLQAFRDGSRYLADNPEAALIVREELGSASSGGRLDRLRQLIWPPRPLWLRPAVAYLAVILLLPLAYRGIRQRPEADRPPITPVRTVDLVSLRGTRQPVLAQPAEGLVLRFAFAGADPGLPYQVTLARGGERLYEQESFRFDAQRVGYLWVPAGMVRQGTYMLIISDPRDPTAIGTDSLSFEIRF